MNGLTHEDGDRWQIYEAVLRYCRGIDRHDTELMRSAYHPDAIDHHTGFSGKVGDFIDWLDPLWKYYKGSMHFVGNHWAEISGNDAVVETYGMSVHWGELEDDKLNTTNGFRYVDHMTKRDGRWAIQERWAVRDWTRSDAGRYVGKEAQGPSGSRDAEDPLWVLKRRRDIK